VGATVRAVAEDPKLAQLFGIDASLVYLGVFVFEAATVAFAATLVAPHSPILTSMGFDEVILTFVVVVLGGVGSVLGTLVASLGLGLFTAFFGALVSPAYTTAAAFAVVLAVLVLRPAGLAAK
jgi:branched-chain amino acid transport system permease protein